MQTRRATAAAFVGYELSAAALAEEPRHLQLARTFIGTKETSGNRDNPVIMQFYADVGHDYVEHDEVAWCAAFVGAMFERCGIRSTRALNARSYLKWGDTVDPEFARPGDVAIFTRGKNTWQGHVAFVLRVAATFVEVLGGNQGNAVSIARYPRERLLGVRRLGKGGMNVQGLKFGDQGRRVRALQEQLTELGYAVGHIDGAFGSRTREAMFAFEADNALPTDGVASESDMEVMEKAPKRGVSEARKNATLTSLAERSTIAKAAVQNIGAGGILSGAGVLSVLGEFSGTLGVVGDALSVVRGFIQDNGLLIGVAVIGAGAWIAWQAWKSGNARVQGERAGRIM